MVVSASKCADMQLLGSQGSRPMSNSTYDKIRADGSTYSFLYQMWAAWSNVPEVFDTLHLGAYMPCEDYGVAVKRAAFRKSKEVADVYASIR